MSALTEIAGELEDRGIAFSLVDIPSIRSLVSREGDRVFCMHLSNRELSCMSATKIMKRKLDFLSGRIAGKRAVMRFIESGRCAKQGARDEAAVIAHIEIRRARTGAPLVFFNNSPALMRVSISHSPSYAASIVSGMTEYRGIGIDLEKIEHRDKSLREVAFSENEIRAMSGRARKNCTSLDEQITRCWSMKEAVLKSMGIGLTVDLKDIEIIEKNDGSLHVKFANDAEIRFDELGSRRVEVKDYIFNDHVLSIACLY